MGAMWRNGPRPSTRGLEVAAVLALLVLCLAPPVRGQGPPVREPDIPVDAPPAPPPADAARADATSAAPIIILGPEAPVRLGDRTVYAIRVGHGVTSAEERARSASAALERLRDVGEMPNIHFVVGREVAVIYGGKAPILQLYQADVAAAGDSSLAVHAASVTEKITDAFLSERRRKAVTSTIFSLVVLVLSGLVALWLLRKATYYIDRGRNWVKANPQKIPSLRVLSLELVRPAAVRTGMSVALGMGRFLTQIGIVYGWVLLGLSLFDATRGYGARLTGYVLAPIGALVGRIGSAIPIALVATLALVAVLILLRFVRLFFVSVAKGETFLTLVPPDVAFATGVLVRAGIVVVVLLLASPLITGSDDGSLSRAGLAALVAVALACTPILASVAAGMPIVYGRRLQPGDHVEIGRRSGQVKSVDLLDIKLLDESGCEVRVPHLTCLFHTTRVLGRAPLATVTVSVDPRARQSDVRALLLERARRFGPTASVQLEQLDARGALYRVTAPAGADGEDLACAVADALTEKGIRLAGGGEPPRLPPP
jgi:small-conductance mechanosensitive channel